MPSRKPRCFIAMAFDKADTDDLYEKSIRPVLRELGIEPVIINRRESNDDLNIQIIESLDECDLCIADLTYTRPSVYFEAGYAERLVPVVYTVRSDHLRREQPDDARVHFDLQMKPLLRWSTPSDTAFRQRLTRRIRATFLRSWSRDRAADDALASERHFLSAQSLSGRIRLARRTVFSELMRAGFRHWEAFARANSPPKDLRAMEVYSDPLYSTSARLGVQRISLVVVVESATPPVLRNLMEMAPWLGPYGHATQGRTTTLPVRASILCIALNTLPAARFSRWFPSFSPTENPSRLVSDYTPESSPVPVRRTVELISPTRSLYELGKATRAAIAAAFAPTA